jgi:Uma2 family endonuclease
MQIALPELHSPATLILDREHGLSDDEYLAFCQANPDLRLERTAQGEIVIVPPAGGESDYRSLEVGAQLRDWARKDGRGKSFGTSVEFLLPDGSAFSPDSAWVSNERLSPLSKAERRQFLRVTPEFVVEVLSPSDRSSAAQRKMNAWIANGVELAWLIDGDSRCVHVYRKGSEPRVHSGIERLTGEGPVDGFVLELSDIWEGL